MLRARTQQHSSGPAAPGRAGRSHTRDPTASCTPPDPAGSAGKLARGCNAVQSGGPPQLGAARCACGGTGADFSLLLATWSRIASLWVRVAHLSRKPPRRGTLVWFAVRTPRAVACACMPWRLSLTLPGQMRQYSTCHRHFQPLVQSVVCVTIKLLSTMYSVAKLPCLGYTLFC